MYAFIFSVVQYYIASVLQVYSYSRCFAGAPVNILPALHLIMEITWECMHILERCISIDVHGGINVLSYAGPSCQVLS